MKCTICIGSSCHLKGSRQIVEELQYLVKENHLEDKVELKASFCLGHCTDGVSTKINGEFVDHVSPENAVEIFNKYVLEPIQNGN